MRRYAPERTSVFDGDRYWVDLPVTRTILHPPGTCARAPILRSLYVLELVTPKGSRFFGVEGGRIDSTLRMEVWGGCINERNELIRNWPTPRGE